MNDMQLVRFFHPKVGAAVGVLRNDVVCDVTEAVGSVAVWLRGSVGRVADAIAELGAAADVAVRTFPAVLFDQPPAPDVPHWLPAADEQDVWAAGVTYERSRAARQEEAQDGGDVYARVYTAQRPELFFKAKGSWVVGQWGQVGIRRDATWNVPEPELALVINPVMEIVGVTVGNDMSSRDIEGENPLYLPQAKMYTASCALAPGILLRQMDEHWPALDIHLRIERDGQEVFSGSTSTQKIRRTPRELADYLGRSLAFPQGAVLLTGTGIVPPESFTLAAGDVVTIAIDGVGTLINTVKTV
jgi:2-dehydro-3-deoxy-D-arabinonate dehydratase